MRRSARLVLSGVLSAALLGCADLPTIALGVCGNGVVEASSGEDCDGAGLPGLQCGAPTTAHACRYVCDEKTACPSGFSCGVDGVCRTPSGAWSAAATTIHVLEAPLDVAIADADGDGLGDVIEQAQGSVTVHYDVTSTAPAALTITRDKILPALGPIADLSADGRADAVVPAGLGFFVSLGDADRIERATAYGALRLPAEASEVQALSAEVLPDLPGSEVLVLAEVQAPSGLKAPALVYVGGSGALAFIAVLPESPGRLAGPVIPGKLDEDARATPCDELVLPYAGATALDLLVPCARDGTGKTTLAENAQTTEIKLPRGAAISGPASIEDLNLDGHLDLVVIAKRGDRFEIDVAYGRGDGTFDSVTTADRSVPADGAAGIAVSVGTNVPLAVYDIDGDERPDWVDAGGVYLARPMVPLSAALNAGTAWTSALIGRFDGDALPDVVVGSNAAPGLSVFSNAGGGSLTAHSVSTRDPASKLAYGDFDGDRIQDFAVATSTRTTEADHDTLSIVFGSPFGAPSAPKDIGEFHRVHQLATARIATGNPPVVDGADDLGALAEGEDGALAYAVVLGDGNRDLRAPFALSTTDVQAQTLTGYAPFRLTVGDVNADGHPDVMALGARIDGANEYRLASIPMYGQASIGLGGSTFSEPLDMSFDWPHVLFGAANLDGTPGDELVILGPRVDATGSQGAIAHAATDAGAALSYSLGTPFPVEDTFTRTEQTPPSPLVANGRLRVADLDGDGAPDVLALGQRNGRGELVVYFNDQTGTLGTPTAIPDSERLDIRDFAMVTSGTLAGTTNRKTETEALLLTSDGVYAVHARGRHLTLDATPGLVTQRNSNATLLGVGDVNGDGVPDLALAGLDGMDIHLGASTNSHDLR